MYQWVEGYNGCLGNNIILYWLISDKYGAINTRIVSRYAENKCYNSRSPPNHLPPASSDSLQQCERILRESAADVSIRRCWRTKPEVKRAERRPRTEVWVNYPCLLSSRTTPASAGCVREPHCRSSFRIQTI